MKPNLTSNIFLNKLKKKNNLIYSENCVIHNTFFFNFMFFTLLLLFLLFLIYLYHDKQMRLKAQQIIKERKKEKHLKENLKKSKKKIKENLKKQ